jgi:glutamate dehydrogenase/leucine dehydrogenase
VLDGLDRGNPLWIRQQGPWSNLPREAIFDLETDIFIPCARVHSIDAGRAKGLEARLILPIANAPCTAEALDVFEHRGIVCVPSYVVNGGGVCGHVMKNVSPENLGGATRFIDSFKPMVVRLLETAATRGVTPQSLADEVAHRNYAAISQESYEQTPFKTRAIRRLQAAGLFPGNLAQQEMQGRIKRTLDHVNGLFR